MEKYCYFCTYIINININFIAMKRIFTMFLALILLTGGMVKAQQEKQMPQTSTTIVTDVITVNDAAQTGVTTSTFPLIEDFESGVFPPGNWTVINTHSNSDANWHLVEFETGGYGAEVLYYDSQMMDEWLISPTLNLSSVSGSVELSFDFLMSYYWMVDPYDGADLMVKISTDGGTTWNEVWKEENFGTFDNWTWYTVNLILNNLSGQSNVKIAFNFYGDDGAQVNIDNISLSPATGIQEIDPNQVKIYPNPSNGVVNIVAAETSHITIYDMVGKLIDSHYVTENEMLTIHQLSGLYVVKVETEKGISSYKLVIK